MNTYSIAEAILTISFFVFGMIALLIDFIFLHIIILFLNALLMVFLIYDLNAPDLVGGIGNIRWMRLFFACFGALVLILTPYGVFAFIFVVISLLVVAVAFPSRLLKDIRWKAKRGRVQQTFRRLLRAERKKDPSFMRKRIRVFHKFEMPASDFLKALSLGIHLLETLFVVAVLSLFIGALGYSLVMEMSLFALFIIWTCWKSWKLFLQKFRSSRKRVETLWNRFDSLEKSTWAYLIKKFLTPRGVLYFFLFIPSILISLALIAVSAQVFFEVASFILENSISLHTLVVPVIALFVFLIIVSINMIYPFYLLTKLTIAQAYRKKRGGYRKDIYLLPAPRLCLFVSIVFSVFFHLPTDVLGLSIFGFTSLMVMLTTILVVLSVIVWIRTILIRHKIKQKRTNTQKMNEKLENQLALGVSLLLLPFLRLLTLELILETILAFFLLLVFGDVIRVARGVEQQEKRVAVEVLIVLSIVSVFIYTFDPASNWIISFCFVVDLMAIMILLPSRVINLVVNKLLMIEEIDAPREEEATRI